MVCGLAAAKTISRKAAQFVYLFRKTPALKRSFEDEENAGHYHLHLGLINQAFESVGVGTGYIVRKF
jgi:hypothetical protein